MLIGIYIGTTISSLILFTVCSKAMDERMSREGYKSLKNEKGKAERTLEILKDCFVLLVPVLNILMASVFVYDYNKVYKDFLITGIADGSIVKKDEFDLEEEKRKMLKKNKKNSEKQSIIKEISINKSYSSMTNEEKLAVLEQEKAFLLSLNQRTTEKTNSSKGQYVKK